MQELWNTDFPKLLQGPSENYNDSTAINATSIKAGRKSMLHMHYEMNRKDDNATPAMVRGTHIHTAVLEPHNLGKLHVWDKPKKSKAWTEFKQGKNVRDIVTTAYLNELLQIRDSVLGNKEAFLLLNEGIEIEKFLYWNGPYGKAKARADGIDLNQILEVKSTKDIHPRDFQRQSFNMGYHLQYGWYQEGMEAIGCGCLPVYILAIENKAPFDVCVFEVDSELIAFGRNQAVQIAKAYNACRISNFFPGVASDIQSLTLPEWAKEKIELNFD